MPFREILTAGAVIAALTIATTCGQAAVCEVGVNVNSFQNFSATEQETILQQLKSSGVRCVRTSMRPDEKDLTLVQNLQKAGIGLVLNVPAVSPPGTPVRPANAQHHMRAATPLSAADPVASKAYYQSLFDQLDARGIKVTAFELGNELNWSDFNGDFPVPGQGKAFTLADLSHDPEAEKVAKGFLVYLKLLAALKDVRDHSKVNQHTPIITSGMAAVSSGPWLKHMQVDGVSIPATYEFLRAHGLDQLVDGYGVHDYPPEVKAGDKKADAERAAKIEATIFPPGNTKPYWLTEWGFASKATSDAQDGERTRSVAQIRSLLLTLDREGRLGGIFWYVWNEPDACSIYRNGAIMEAGRKATAPMPTR